MSLAWTVFRKEFTDALRDRRAWVIMLIVSMLSGPVVFLLLSNFISSLEERAAQREILVVAPARAPTLVNYLQRAGANVKEAPPDFVAQLRSGRLQNAVVVPPADFEAQLAGGTTITVEVDFDESHDKAQSIVRNTIRMLNGFNRELGAQRLLARGVSPQLLAPLAVEEVNLVGSRARGAQLLFLVPWAALVIAVFGALSVAIDVTAGERERGSLEPLLMNPVRTHTLVLGKWAVVMFYSVVIVLLTMLGFVVSMRFISNETMAALMQLQWREAAVFAAVLLPFTALMAAINMLAATFGKTYKEAQTYVSYITMTVQFAAVVPVFLTERDAGWQLLVPSVGQLAVLLKALRGESIEAADLLVPAAVCLLGTALALGVLMRLLRQEKVIFARS